MDEIEVEVVAESKDHMPFYASELAAGADVKAHITEEWVIGPSESRLVPTGLKMAPPQGYEIQVRPRSGLALKSQVTVLNTPGTIDADYRGEICVLLINHGKNPFVVTPGMRIAQLIFAPVTRARFVLKEELTTTTRGEGGFGHTGTH